MKLLSVIAALGLAGCSRTLRPATPSNSSTPNVQVWGSMGAGAGEFIQPRAIALAPGGPGKPDRDHPESVAYVADTTGRILKWSTNGKFLASWLTPKLRSDLPEGPEGIAVLQNGDIAYSNTHASIVTILTPAGKFVRSFGSYGTGPGQFLLVTGVAIDSDGNFYCADYGGELDRISKWSKSGVLLATWRGHGEGPRQFRRPCGLAISKEGDLLVADVGNGRIQRLDRKTGEYKGVIGSRGRADGQLNYPFGVTTDSAGNIYTVEFGAQRVQKWTASGKWIASWGGPGKTPGKLFNPRGIAVDKAGNVYVTDTLNNRVQKFHF